ncbi:MAG TPA: exodeoxyribonuclease VII small subunit [Acidimicrobiales bacterium]|nr:exodeoxyribonuclease VII small subunit [Acidimicrobiales bacterium]
MTADLPAPKPVAELSYTEASHELDGIVEFFEQREVDVDQLVHRLERATAIVDELDRRIRQTRAQVEELVPRLEGAARRTLTGEPADEGLAATDDPALEPPEDQLEAGREAWDVTEDENSAEDAGDDTGQALF